MWILPLHNTKHTDDENGQANADDDEEQNVETKQEQFKIHTSDDLVTSLLYPLSGPEEISDEDDRLLLDPILYSLGPDKIRERDVQTRLYIVETLLLLCASGRQVREILRSKGAYVILKYADLVEEEEDIPDEAAFGGVDEEASLADTDIEE